MIAAAQDVRARILARVAMPEGEGGCWLWQRSLHRNGYGYIAINGKQKRAHRIAYQQWKGEIAEGLDLDHLCRVRGCVNPAHLEPVTRKENVARSPIIGKARTHCAKGHDLGPATDESRTCRTCARLAVQARRSARAVEPKPAPTHCKQGHEYTPANTMQRGDGRRRCRACFNAWHRARDKASRAFKVLLSDPTRV